MSPNPLPRPTEAELAILGVLWAEGPSTVRQVHAGLPNGGRVGYTTILKLMQIMTEKGLLHRDESSRAHVYHAACDEERTQRRLVGDLLDRAFQGASGRLAVQALGQGRASADEIAEIRRLLDAMEEGDER